MGKKAIVAGHVVVDITPAFVNPPVSRYDALFVPGNLVTVGPAHIQGGGCVSNTGLAMDFFGADVTLLGRVGDDAFGKILQEQYQKAGVSVRWIVDAEVPTGYTIVISPVGLERMYLHNEGANASLCNADFPEELWAQTDLFHFGYPPLLRHYYEDGGQELIALFQHAKAHGIVTSMDTVMFDRSSAPARQDWRRILLALMPFLDLFAPSLEELLLMMEPEKYERLHREANGRDVLELVRFEEDVRPLAQALLDAGVRVLLIKCGTRGLALFTASASRLESMREKLDLPDTWAECEFLQPAFVADRVCTTTGAGDTSIAAFLTALLQGMTPERALRLAAGAGACCVTAYDSFSGLQSFAAMEDKMRSGWATQPSL